MLKQVFDTEQLSKVLSSSDIWRWGVLTTYGGVDVAIENVVQYWKESNLSLSPLSTNMVKGKSVFTPTKMEDAFAIKLVDRFVRRIYKVRQSDRNRIVRQLSTLLKDSGSYHVLRLDIKDCYEAIEFKRLLSKFEDDLILAPECISLLKGIQEDLRTNYDVEGIPRGLSISPTLAELYLETLDKEIAAHPSVIYSSRYVDDIILLTPSGKEDDVQSHIESYLDSMGLELNKNTKKYYSGSSKNAEFDYLGYSLKVVPRNNKPNNVVIKISKPKLDKIKSRIVTSFCDYKYTHNISLLKRRLEYLCMLKVVRKGKNGDLLAGIAHNYQYVTDDFECLRPLDGFLFAQFTNVRFGLSISDLQRINKISFYGNVKKMKVGKFSKRQAANIMKVWKNA